MLKIRLMKPGKSIKGRYHYKVVVTDIRRARDSRFIDELGYYDPARKLLNFNVDKYEDWFKKGARPTETVASLLKRYKKQQSQNKA